MPLNPGFLLASLIWGSIGVGFLMYGTRQKSIPPMVGGILMIVASYFATTTWVMSLICLAIAVIVYILVKQGS